MERKYKKLFSNTIIFSIGTFSSKILVFLLVPFYTYHLSEAEYGTVDLITQTANLLIPLVSLGIASAVLRFGLDNAYNKKAVFTAGVSAILFGFVVFLFFIPLLLSMAAAAPTASPAASPLAMLEVWDFMAHPSFPVVKIAGVPFHRFSRS